MKVLRFLCYFTFILFSTNGYSQYNFKNINVSDGLAQSQVYCLLQDSRGCIWMGTQGGGLSCYNGIEFQNYSVKHGLCSNFINSLVEDSLGNIWIATSKGLNLFDGTKISHVDENLTISIDDMAFDSNSKLWCATELGLFYLVENKLERINSDENWAKQPIYDVLIGSNDEMWLATDNGLVLIDEDNKVFNQNDGLKSRLVNNLEEDSNGDIWISTYGAGVMVYDGESFQSISQFGDLVVFDFIEYDGVMWIGTMKNGLFTYDLETKRITNLTKESGLPNNQIRSLEIDSWGNLWIGTSGGGVSNYSGRQFRYFSRDTGMPGRQIYSIIEDRDKGFWIGNSDLGLFRFFPDSAGVLQSVEGLSSGKVKALLQDQQGRVWAGTSGQGVCVVENDSIWSINQSNGLNSDWIRAFAESENGDIFIGTAGGGINVIHFKDSLNYSIDIFNKQKDLSGLRITDLQFDQYKRLWYSTQSNGVGVILLDGTVLSFDTSGGLQSNSIRSLALDSLGWLWIGSVDNGISKMNLNADVIEFERFDQEQEDFYSSKNIYLLQFDALNNLWYGTESGVSHVILDANRQILDWTNYGKEEGFFGIETCTNSSLLDSDKNLWFGTIDGLNKTHHSYKIENQKAPKIRINGISLFYKPLEETHLKPYLKNWGGVKDTLILTYEQNHLSFDFIGINLPNPNKVSYQWMLEGSEMDWSPLTKKKSISYSNLKPGLYTFKVRACNEDGICNQEPEYVHFNILTPFWQKPFYQLIFGLLVLFLLSALFFWRVREIKIKSKNKTNRLNLEKNLIELEQKALRLQMNPHFIFNSLNSIQGLIAKDDPKTARLYLSRFSRLMRQTLENSREALITVEDEIDALKNFLDLEKFTHNDSFEYTVEMEDVVKDCLIPPLLIQPFVENSILHGVLPNNSGGKIDVLFKKSGDNLLIEIKDNGIGRKKSEELKAEKSKYHKSTGLEVTSERVEALGENSKIEFVDLFDENNHSKGTIVRLRLPILE